MPALPGAFIPFSRTTSSYSRSLISVNFLLAHLCKIYIFIWTASSTAISDLSASEECDESNSESPEKAPYLHCTTDGLERSEG